MRVIGLRFFGYRSPKPIILRGLKGSIGRTLKSKVLRVAVPVIVFCITAIWLSDAEIRTGKDLAAVLFSNAEPIAISSAAVVFILESSDRRKADQYEAWQVINAATGQTGNGGRIQALEDLNKDGVVLEGVAAPGADLSNINLEYGKLQRARLENAQLDHAKLRGASLSYANLRHANLSSADLRGASLFKAKLEDANLNGANLRNTDLRGANLSHANLIGADLSEALLFPTILNGAMVAHTKFGSGRGLSKEEKVDLQSRGGLFDIESKPRVYQVLPCAEETETNSHSSSDSWL